MGVTIADPTPGPTPADPASASGPAPAPELPSGAPLTTEATGSSALLPGSDVATALVRPKTILQSGIVKPKKFHEGVIRYGNFCSTGEPESVQEAFADPQWRKAMEDEYVALVKNQTWHLVSQKEGMNLIDCKWVFKIKRKADGTIDRYKARLVAKGFKQRYGI